MSPTRSGSDGSGGRFPSTIRVQSAHSEFHSGNTMSTTSTSRRARTRQTKRQSSPVPGYDGSGAKERGKTEATDTTSTEFETRLGRWLGNQREKLGGDHLSEDGGRLGGVGGGRGSPTAAAMGSFDYIEGPPTSPYAATPQQRAALRTKTFQQFKSGRGSGGNRGRLLARLQQSATSHLRSGGGSAGGQDMVNTGVEAGVGASKPVSPVSPGGRTWEARGGAYFLVPVKSPSERGGGASGGSSGGE